MLMQPSIDTVLGVVLYVVMLLVCVLLLVQVHGYG